MHYCIVALHYIQCFRKRVSIIYSLLYKSQMKWWWLAFHNFPVSTTLKKMQKRNLLELIIYGDLFSAFSQRNWRMFLLNAVGAFITSILTSSKHVQLATTSKKRSQHFSMSILFILCALANIQMRSHSYHYVDGMFKLCHYSI